MTTPVEVKRIESRSLQITWADGLRVVVEGAALRAACPCAACREKRGDTSHAQPLTGGAPASKGLLNIVTASADDELRLDKVWAIGNYAVGVRWGDGHDTGIYTYSLLRELSTHRVEIPPVLAKQDGSP